MSTLILGGKAMQIRIILLLKGVKSITFWRNAVDSDEISKLPWGFPM